MKKTYISPQIMFDSFELTDNIASGCAFLNSNIQPYVCPVLEKEWGYTIFSDLTICDSTPTGGNDSICYHIPVADSNVYTS